MKKILSILLVSTVALGLIACSNERNDVGNSTANQKPTNTEDSINNDFYVNRDGKVLIAYFSMPEDIDVDDVDAVSGASIVVKDNQVFGNVEYMANVINKTIGGNLFQIKTEEDYPLNHETLVDRAAQEQDDNARPVLSTHVENIDAYDTIFLGYPNWWGDMPQALYTFLEEYDLSGKTIIPFCPHGGSGFSNTINTIEELQPNATISEDGLSISRDDVVNSEDTIVEWLNDLGF